MNDELASRLNANSSNSKITTDREIIHLPKTTKDSTRQFVEIHKENINLPEVTMRAGQFSSELTNINRNGIPIATPFGGDAPTIRSGADAHVRRISPLNCETIYIREGLVYGWVNKLTGYHLASKPAIVCGNEAEQKQMDEIISENDLRKLLKHLFNHKYIYGNFILKWETESKKIVGTTWIDPKYFDAIRDSEGRVQYDKEGDIAGYVQYLKWNQQSPPGRAIEQPTAWPYQSGSGMKFAPDEIVQFKLNDVGDDWWGVGLIEPIYNFVRVKQNADDGFGEMLQRTGFPRIMAYVGDESHPPTQEQVDDVWNNLSDLYTKHQFVGPYYYKFEILESKKPDRFRYNLQYLQDGMVTGLGGPKPLVTGLGEDTNRSTLEDQKLWLEIELKNQQEDCGAEFEEQVLKKIAEQYGFSTTPKLVWNETSIDSIQSKIDRLAKLSTAKLIAPTEELLKHIEKMEDLPPNSLFIPEPEKPKEPVKPEEPEKVEEKKEPKKEEE